MNARPTLTLRRSAAPPTPLLEHFWFVWRVGALRPSKQHASREVAIAEAQRLRQLYPDLKFHVYEATLVGEEIAATE